MKTAALAYVADNPSVTDLPDESLIIKYLKDGSATLETGYSFDVGTIPANAWYAIYTIQGTTTEISKIQDKLKARASQVGLCEGLTSADYNGGTQVSMFIR